MKQVPRAWYRKIGEFLVHSGFKVTPSDSILFVKTKDGRLAIVLVYVDDLIIGTIMRRYKGQEKISQYSFR